MKKTFLILEFKKTSYFKSLIFDNFLIFLDLDQILIFLLDTILLITLFFSVISTDISKLFDKFGLF